MHKTDQAGPLDQKRIARRDSLALFLLLYFVYAATSSGDLMADSEIRWATARSLVEHGWFDIPAEFTPQHAVGVDGKAYSFYAPGQALLLAPFAAAGRAIAALNLPIGGGGDMFGQFLASVVLFPLCGAAAMVVLLWVVRDLTGSAPAARIVALLCGLATMHWHHTISGGDESQVALCALVALWAMQRAWPGGSWPLRWLCMAAMGLAVCFRPSAAIICVPLGLVGFAFDMIQVPQDRGRRLLGWIVAGVLGLLPFLLGLAWFNWVRFGVWSETGYAAAHENFIGGVQLFETPFRAGLGGLLISPGKGVFDYNPILLSALVGWPGFYRMSRGMALIAATVFAVVVLAHSKYTFWAGDFTWGPRYLASTMGFCMLGLVPLIEGRRWRAALWGVAALSGAIQVASTFFSYGLEFAQDRRHGSIPDEYVWRLPESHLVMRFRNIALYALGRPIYDSIPPVVVRPAFHQVPTSPDVVRLNHVVHYFPFKAYLFTTNVRVFRLLLGVWLLDLLAVIAVAAWWRAAVHRSHVHVPHEAP